MREETALPRRVTGGMLLVGIFLLALATVLHPRVFAPSQAGEALRHAVHSAWAAVHWVGAAGIVITGAGLAGLHAWIRRIGGRWAPCWAPPLLYAGITLWLLIFVLEAAALPRIAALGETGGPVWRAFGEAVFQASLFLGDVAALCLTVALVLWSADLLSTRAIASWLGWVGVGSASAAAIASVVLIVFPESGSRVFVLVPFALLAVWIAILGWRLLKG